MSSWCTKRSQINQPMLHLQNQPFPKFEHITIRKPYIGCLNNNDILKICVSYTTEILLSSVTLSTTYVLFFHIYVVIYVLINSNHVHYVILPFTSWSVQLKLNISLLLFFFLVYVSQVQPFQPTLSNLAPGRWLELPILLNMINLQYIFLSLILLSEKSL